MREITFRGKANDQYNARTGEWIYGQLLVRPVHEGGMDEYFICETGHKFIRCLNKAPCTYEVDPETVGQYTGLTDKNGKRIFEGDIVREIFSYPKTYAVKFDEGRGGWYPFACGDGCGCCETDTISSSFIEVIGNIHDNPELIAEVEG